MNTTIPGAEYAPTITLGIRPSTLGDWEQVERRLSCSDPDDMRAIWRRAALALGATEEEALTAVLRADIIDCINLQTYDSRGSERSRFGITTRWSTRYGTWVGDGEDLKRATGALCAHVWGPK